MFYEYIGIVLPFLQLLKPIITQKLHRMQKTESAHMSVLFSVRVS